eukprot:scaffold11538_cov79-Phaeocystis_antarctica.AAC.5
MLPERPCATATTLSTWRNLKKGSLVTGACSNGSGAAFASAVGDGVGGPTASGSSDHSQSRGPSWQRATVGWKAQIARRVGSGHLKGPCTVRRSQSAPVCRGKGPRGSVLDQPEESIGGPRRAGALCSGAAALVPQLALARGLARGPIGPRGRRAEGLGGQGIAGPLPSHRRRHRAAHRHRSRSPTSRGRSAAPH